jgi:hypothetical protein
VTVEGVDNEGEKLLCRNSGEERRPVNFGEGRNNLEETCGGDGDTRIQLALGHCHIHRHLFQRRDVQDRCNEGVLGTFLDLLYCSIIRRIIRRSGGGGDEAKDGLLEILSAVHAAVVVEQ